MFDDMSFSVKATPLRCIYIFFTFENHLSNTDDGCCHWSKLWVPLTRKDFNFSSQPILDACPEYFVAGFRRTN